jgi:hypothetical protein
MKHARTAIWLLVLGLLLFSIVRAAVSLHILPLNDFIEYWAAGRVFLDGGDPYNPEAMLKVQQSLGWQSSTPLMMWNPPWTLLLVAPFAAMPFWVARAIWFLLNVVLSIVAVDRLWSLYHAPNEWRWIAWISVLFFVPTIMVLFIGQVGPLLLAALAGFVLAQNSGRERMAGVAASVLSVKPHLLYLFWFFLLVWSFRTRRWTTAVFSALSAGVCSLIVALTNRGAVSGYLHSLFSDEGPLRWQTPSLGTAVRIAFSVESRFLQVVPSVLGLAAAVWLWRRWRDSFSWPEHLPDVVVLSVVTASFSWTFDWVVLLIPQTALLVRFSKEPRKKWWLLAGLTLIQVGLFAQLTVIDNYFYTLWLPPVLALLYAAARVSETRMAQQRAA